MQSEEIYQSLVRNIDNVCLGEFDEGPWGNGEIAAATRLVPKESSSEADR